MIGLSLLSKPEQLGKCIDAAHHDLVNEISDSCKIAVSILDDLLAYEKMESGIFKLETSRVHFASLIAEAARPFRLSAAAKGVELRMMEDNLQASFENIFVDIDVAKISQVVRNFLSNACKFTPSGGTVTVSLHLLPEGPAPTAVLFKVTDTGAGMAPENLKRIFKEVIQFNAAKLQEGKGSGLGLYVSRQIIELHGGTVHVDSPGEGSGCEFSFELPLNLRPSESANLREILNSMSSVGDVARISYKGRFEVTPPQSMMGHETSRVIVPCFQPLPAVAEDMRSDLHQNVLLVDDSEVNRKMMKRLLTSLGYEITEAEDGSEAVLKTQQAMDDGHVYSAIFMDFYMPKMSGPDATRAIRALGYAGNIIGVTGNGINEDREEFLQSGLDAILIKPIREDDLQNAINCGSK